MVAKEKIGIFGGTFNPIHTGHLRLCASFRQSLKLDRVFLVPNFTPPHKEAKELVGGDDRLKMCCLAAHGTQGLEVCDFEVRRSEKSYTVNTLDYFTEKYPGAELYLLMGGDMFVTVDEWFQSERLFKTAVICAGSREQGEYLALCNYEKKLNAMGAKTRVISIEPYVLSSTDIRARLAAGEDIADLVPKKVLKYITAAGLYGAPDKNAEYKSLIKACLSERRFEHSVCVARECAMLSIMFGADEKKAYTAGILHDITKEMPYDEQLQMLTEFGIILNSVEKDSPKLWHAITGALFVEEKLGIKDSEIMNAIRYHTTACDDISLLSKIVYLADGISFERDYDGVNEIRGRLALGLDAAMLCALSQSIIGLVQKGCALHADTLAAYNRIAIEGQH